MKRVFALCERSLLDGGSLAGLLPTALLILDLALFLIHRNEDGVKDCGGGDGGGWERGREKERVVL